MFTNKMLLLFAFCIHIFFFLVTEMRGRESRRRERPQTTVADLSLLEERMPPLPRLPTDVIVLILLKTLKSRKVCSVPSNSCRLTKRLESRSHPAGLKGDLEAVVLE